MNLPTIASIGYGAMARALQAGLARNSDSLRLSGALVRSTADQEATTNFTLWQSLQELIAAKPDLVVECAGHSAAREVVPALLEAGIDVIIASVGALSDSQTRDRIDRAAQTGKARATVVSGAIGGLDVLRAAALAGLDEVTYVGRKPPAAWKGTPAEHLLDLDVLRESTEFFNGDAASAAAEYPKNANVTAAVALAGLGFDRTRVRLVADPHQQTNSHELEAIGPFGQFRIILDNNPLPENPKTSWLAALSAEQAVFRHFSNLEL